MFNRFPKIKDFKFAAKHAYKMGMRGRQHYYVLPKMHGTNAGLCFKDGEVFPQSRNRMLTLEKDNAGFALFVEQNKEEILAFFGPEDKYVYGEFVGRGIQEIGALSQMAEKYFVAFLVLEAGEWMVVDQTTHAPEKVGDSKIRTITEFPVEPGARYNLPIWSVDIEDAEDIETQYAKLVEFMDAVEAECPVAKKLEGISGIGEGVVCVRNGPENKIEGTWFKVKGAEHSKSGRGSSREVRGAAQTTKFYGTAASFISNFFHEDRMAQVIEYLKEMDLPLEKSSTKQALVWAKAEFDEESDGIESIDLSELSEKDVKMYYSALNGVFVPRLHRTFDKIPLDLPAEGV